MGKKELERRRKRLRFEHGRAVTGKKDAGREGSGTRKSGDRKTRTDRGTSSSGHE